MIVVFNGILETSKGGCKPCGAKRASKLKMVTSKSYILPSGTTKTFRAGKETEVDDKDGQFLLTYTYSEGGKTKHVFTKVE